MMNSFIDWTLTIKPRWVGFLCFLSGIIALIIFSGFVVVLILGVTSEKALLLIPIFLLGCWTWALFFQD